MFPSVLARTPADTLAPALAPALAHVFASASLLVPVLARLRIGFEHVHMRPLIGRVYACPRAHVCVRVDNCACARSWAIAYDCASADVDAWPWDSAVPASAFRSAPAGALLHAFSLLPVHVFALVLALAPASGLTCVWVCGCTLARTCACAFTCAFVGACDCIYIDICS